MIPGAQADLIVSGDHHLLDLEAYQRIPMVSAAGGAANNPAPGIFAVTAMPREIGLNIDHCGLPVAARGLN